MRTENERRFSSPGARGRAPKTGPPQPRLNKLWHALVTGTNRGSPESVGRVVNSPGRRLDPDTQRVVAPDFAGDSGKLRIHTGSAAAMSARDLGARAYTSGRDIVFGAGEFSPGTESGRQLLAHELGHVAQQQHQDGSLPALPSVGPQNSAAESAAESGERSTAGTAVSVPPGAVMRQEDPAAGERRERLNSLDNLKSTIDEDTASLQELRKKLNAMPPASSAVLDDQRNSLNTEIRKLEDALVDELKQRLGLLDSEISDLLQSAKTSSQPGDPEPGEASTVLDELGRREAERSDETRQMVLLQRDTTKQDLDAVNAKLTTTAPGPTANYLRLKAEQSRLGNILADTAVNRAKPGTAGTGSDGRPYVVFAHEVKVGGALPWLNNNPGNVTSGSAAQGVIGFNPSGIGFVIFRDMESGKKAAASWWNNHKSNTIGDAIFTYSQGTAHTPQHDADAEKYTKFVEGLTGLDRSRTVGSLNDTEMSSLVTAILTQEGGLSPKNEGDIVTCGDPSGPIEYRRLLGCDE